MKQLINEYFCLSVPECAIQIVADMGYLIYKEPDYKNRVTDAELANLAKLDKYLSRVKEGDDWKPGYIPLPSGQWQLIGKADELTEEQANWIVESDNPSQHSDKVIYRDYLGVKEKDTALESLSTLLTSHSLTASTTVILRKLS
jgi:hypothetical protein